jgi:hypothetical protein
MLEILNSLKSQIDQIAGCVQVEVELGRIASERDRAEITRDPGRATWASIEMLPDPEHQRARQFAGNEIADEVVKFAARHPNLDAGRTMA